MQFEVHGVLQTLFYNKYIDENQHCAECVLSCITCCSRWEMYLQWSLANKFRSCIVVLVYNAWFNYLSILLDHRVLRLTFIYINMYIIYHKMSTVRSPGLERQSSKREIVFCNTALGKDFSFCILASRIIQFVNRFYFYTSIEK